MSHPDFLIAGAGIIGLSLALELERRGAAVTVIDAGKPLQQTSSAAAGMLAVHDHANPPALHPLSELSTQLYPAFLDRIARLSGTLVPFQTSATLESTADPVLALPEPHTLIPALVPNNHHFRLLDEHSVDPRQLAAALLAAVHATSIRVLPDTALHRVHATATSVLVHTSTQPIQAAYLIDCMGCWSPAPVAPVKGQLLAVRTPPSLDLSLVLRTPDVYVVPRTLGPNTGRCIIGATIEDAGFDLTIHPLDILTLHAHAARLLPPLQHAEFLESWSGLRPATVDGLPFLGALAAQPRYIVANGHFRNGILLAPATAHLIAQLLFGQQTLVDLAPFSPERPLHASAAR